MPVMDEAQATKGTETVDAGSESGDDDYTHGSGYTTGDGNGSDEDHEGGIDEGRINEGGRHETCGVYEGKVDGDDEDGNGRGEGPESPMVRICGYLPQPFQGATASGELHPKVSPYLHHTAQQNGARSSGM